MDTQKVHEFVKLESQIKDKEEEIKQLKSKKDELERELIDNFSEEGIPKMTVSLIDSDGKKIDKTVYMKREIWPSHNGDVAGLHQAMVECGLGDMLRKNFHATQFAAHIRSYDPNNEMSPEEIRQNLPTQLQQHIKISEKFKINTRKS